MPDPTTAGHDSAGANMTKFKFKAGREAYIAWYILPTIRFGTWDHRRIKEGHGGFLAFTSLKFDAIVSWSSQ